MPAVVVEKLNNFFPNGIGPDISGIFMWEGNVAQESNWLICLVPMNRILNKPRE